MNRKVNIYVIFNEYSPKIITIRMNMNFGFPNSSWTEYSKNFKKHNSSWIDSNGLESNTIRVGALSVTSPQNKILSA